MDMKRKVPEDVSFPLTVGNVTESPICVLPLQLHGACVKSLMSEEIPKGSPVNLERVDVVLRELLPPFSRSFSAVNMLSLPYRFVYTRHSDDLSS